MRTGRSRQNDPGGRIAAALRAAALLALSACASGAPVREDVVVSGERFANVQGEARFFVRTYVEDINGDRREVSGAKCSVQSSLYQAAFTTPARLRVPNFGGQSPELGIGCSAGDKKGGAISGIRTHWRYPPGGLMYPGIGPYGPYPAYGFRYGYGGGAYPEFRYPDVEILLR